MKKSCNTILVNEYGTGLGHVARLERYANFFLNDGLNVKVALPDPNYGKNVFHTQPVIFKAPVFKRPAFLTKKSALCEHQEKQISYASFLKDIGAVENSALKSLLAEWSKLFANLKPDILVCDNAPGACMAAMISGIATVSIGTGHTVPALKDGYFVPYSTNKTPDKPYQDTIRSQLERNLRKLNISLNRDVFDAFRGQHCHPNTLRELDPAGEHRLERCFPPEISMGSADIMRSGDRVLIYMSFDTKYSTKLIYFLAQNNLQVEIYASPNQQLDFVAHPNVIITHKKFDVDYIRQHARLLINHGGAGIVQMGALAGVPQFAFYSSHERWRYSSVIQQRYAGLARPLDEIDHEDVHRIVLSVFNTPGYMGAAQLWRDFARLQFADSTSFDRIREIITTI
jgi:hypothetical protein